MKFRHLADIDLECRQYQDQLVTDSIDVLERGRRPCTVLATGGGKTRGMAELTRRVLLSGMYNRVVFACHSMDLLRQIHTEVRKLRLQVGWFAPNMQENIMAPLQLVMTPTLARRKDNPRFNTYINLIQRQDSLVKVDEGHRGSNGAGGEILVSRQSRHSLMCWTATPWLTGNRTLDGVYDEIVQGPTVADLQSMGHLVYGRYVEPDEPVRRADLHKRGGDFIAAEISRLMREAPGFTDKMVRFVTDTMKGKKAIYFVADRLHAFHVKDALDKLGVKSEIILDDTKDREGALDRVKNSPDVSAIARDILTTGIDIPDLEAVVLLRATESPIVHFQQIGRVLRPCPRTGKQYGWVFDFVGNIRKHGRPESIGYYTFDEPRLTGSREIGKKTCPDCGYENFTLRLRCVQCNFLFEEMCPECENDLFFSQDVCRICGFDKRTQEEMVKAMIQAQLRLQKLQAALKGNFFLDNIDRFVVQYTLQVREGYENNTDPRQPLLWLDAHFQQGTHTSVLQEITLYTLWDKEEVDANPGLYIQAYIEYILDWRSSRRGFVPDGDVQRLVDLQFGTDGRAFLDAYRWRRGMKLRA